MSFFLKQYGVILKRIEENDIELIRRMRNSPSIRMWMGYKKTISETQQKVWFESVNNFYNYYFLIIIGGNTIGVINCKDVNIKNEYGEGGIFVWDKNFIDTPYPLIASIILLDFIFNKLEIGDKSFIRILEKNQKAIKYNKSIGYTLIPGQTKSRNQWYVLTKEGYNKRAQRIRRAAAIFTETDGGFYIEGVKSEINLIEINNLLL